MGFHVGQLQCTFGVGGNEQVCPPFIYLSKSPSTAHACGPQNVTFCIPESMVIQVVDR